VIGYTIRRLINLVPILVGVSILTFLLIHAIPGDPAAIRAGVSATPEQVEAVRRQFGLDDPLPVQYLHYLRDIVTGNFGSSFITGQDVGPELVRRFFFTFRFSLIAMCLALVLGILAGVASALRPRTLADTCITGLSILGLAMPSFWLGLMLLQVFAGTWQVLPSGGSGSWRNLVLPSIVLATSSAAVLARMTRASMLDTLDQDFVRTLKAAGVRRPQIVYKHALRNALNPVITMAGLQFGFMLAGTVVVEVVFSLPGVGRMIVTSIFARDYPVVQGGLLLLATTFVLVNLVTDLLYAIANPRIRYGSD
jgi:peptide/nickel transport system permease protein